MMENNVTCYLRQDENQEGIVSMCCFLENTADCQYIENDDAESNLNQRPKMSYAVKYMGKMS